MPPSSPTSVVAIIPARDEAESIGVTVSSLLSQTHPLEAVFVVDDSSTDGTAAVAHASANGDARLSVIAGLDLPPGWTGKLWAVSQGLDAAEKLQAEWCLLTDADIVHAPTCVASLLSRAQSSRLDLASYMVRLEAQAAPEKALIPAFVFFFFLLYPPRFIADPASRVAGAAGGCMLVRRTALERIGGIASIRGALIDDCSLAQKIKASGGRIWLGLTDDTCSTRRYGTFSEISRMISRTAFTQLNHSVWLLAIALGGLMVTYLAPFLAILAGSKPAVITGVLAWALMTAAYLPAIRFYRLMPFWAVLLPAVAMFYAGATVLSAFQYWTGRGGYWKGRTQDVKQN